MSAGSKPATQPATRGGLLHWWRVFLRKPLNLGSSILLVLAALCLAAAIFFPVWKMRLVAPQYPKGLDMRIYVWKLEGGNKGQDLIEINLLNHYIGMKSLAEADFLEMQWMPFVFGLFFILLLRAAVLCKMVPVIDMIVMFAYFGVFSIGTFAYRLYTYGHNLDPTAAVTIKPFMPTLIGVNKIANFTQISYPQWGAYLLMLSWLLIVVAAVWSHREEPI